MSMHSAHIANVMLCYCVLLFDVSFFLSDVSIRFSVDLNEFLLINLSIRDWCVNMNRFAVGGDNEVYHTF